jgi:diaminopimelate decarboxylase
MTSEIISKTISGKSIKPPYYILDEDRLEKDFHKFRKAFSSLYNRFILAYSYKANYLPYMCGKLHGLGAYAEVVSGLEYDLACRLIGDTSKIIFNGPVKSYHDLENALNNRSIVNIDSFYEIQHLERYCRKFPHQRAKIGIRVNFVLHGDRNLPFKTSRFGFCLENGDLRKAVSKIREISNAEITGLHAHFSTKSRSTIIFREITTRLCEIALKDLKGGSIKYIDIGGNLGRAPKEMCGLSFPSYREYAREIIQELKRHMNDSFKPTLIIEPGVSLVGQAYDYVCNVIEVKKVRRKKFIVLDGSVHNIKPTMHTFNLPVKVINSKGAIKTGRKFTYQVVGYTCMESDILLKDFRCPEIKRGDFFVFGNVGAYTLVLKPPFIQPDPPIIARKNNRYKIIRRGETFRDFFSTYEL